MTFADYFDRIRVINLPERIDRRREIARELADAGLPLDPGRVEIFPACRMAAADGFATVGLHGCYRSHLQILREARDDGARRVLVIEDDLQIARIFPKHADALAGQLAAHDWGFAYFGHPIEVPSPTVPTLIRHDGHIELTHFYAVNGPTLDPLVRFLELLLTRPAGHPDGGPMSPDGALSEFRRRHPEIQTLIAAPNLGWQRPSRTDCHPLRWFDRTPVVRDLVGLGRRGKSWLRARAGR